MIEVRCRPRVRLHAREASQSWYYVCDAAGARCFARPLGHTATPWRRLAVSDIRENESTLECGCIVYPRRPRGCCIDGLPKRGRAAVTSFEPEEQVELARFFASKQAADDIGVEKGACIFRNSLDRQAKSDTSPLIAATVNVPSALLETRQNRRYVTVDYETDGCRRLDEDGQCVGRAKRVANAVITVSLESQARTLEEQRRMDRGELEARHALDPHCVRTDHHQGRQTRRPRRREATISRQHLRHFRSRCMMLSCCAACAWVFV